MDMAPGPRILARLCAVAVAAVTLQAWAAGPPPPLPLVPDTAQQRLQARIAAQQAQAQANLAASQAKVQAMLDANQARLEGQVSAQQQAQLAAARQGIARLPALPLAMTWPMPQSATGPLGTLELATLSPQLGRYFGISHGVLVVRAPAHGVLKLEDGDVILSIGGRVPASGSQAIRILTSYDPGDQISLIVLREHHRIEITATMPAPPAGP